MSEEQSNGCLKAFMIFCVLNLLLMGAIGAGYYALWKKKGFPSMEAIQAMVEEKQGFQMGESSGEAEVGEESDAHSSKVANRPIVATAPIQGNAATYKSYTARKDVMTLVNYYSDT